MNNELITEASNLANTFSFEHLKSMEEQFEYFYEYYTSEVYDSERASNGFRLMTLYLLAMSMKDLNFEETDLSYPCYEDAD